MCQAQMHRQRRLDPTAMAGVQRREARSQIGDGHCGGDGDRGACALRGGNQQRNCVLRVLRGPTGLGGFLRRAQSFAEAQPLSTAGGTGSLAGQRGARVKHRSRQRHDRRSGSSSLRPPAAPRGCAPGFPRSRRCRAGSGRRKISDRGAGGVTRNSDHGNGEAKRPERTQGPRRSSCNARL